MADPIKLTQKALKRAGWSQAELARRLEVDNGVVSRVLMGVRRPSLDVAFGIEVLLRVPARAWASSLPSRFLAA